MLRVLGVASTELCNKTSFVGRPHPEDFGWGLGSIDFKAQICAVDTSAAEHGVMRVSTLFSIERHMMVVGS
jgi:hypothetical protein